MSFLQLRGDAACWAGILLWRWGERAGVRDLWGLKRPGLHNEGRRKSITSAQLA